jgi:hypothetical protein
MDMTTSFSLHIMATQIRMLKTRNSFLCVLINKQTGLLELTKDQDWATTNDMGQTLPNLQKI